MEVLPIVKFKEIPDFPTGYGRMTGDSEEEIWDVIMQEMQKVPTKKYLKYFKFEKWEPDGGWYIPNNYKRLKISDLSPEENKSFLEGGRLIPTGTLSVYLKIIVEDR